MPGVVPISLTPRLCVIPDSDVFAFNQMYTSCLQRSDLQDHQRWNKTTAKNKRPQKRMHIYTQRDKVEGKFEKEDRERIQLVPFLSH